MKYNMQFTCDYCGAEISQKDKDCSVCGAVFTRVRCPRCGYTAENNFFKKGCPTCFYKAPDFIKYSTKNVSNKKKNLHFWIYIILILTVNIALFLYAGLYLLK